MCTHTSVDHVACVLTIITANCYNLRAVAAAANSDNCVRWRPIVSATKVASETRAFLRTLRKICLICLYSQVRLHVCVCVRVCLCVVLIRANLMCGTKKKTKIFRITQQQQQQQQH